MAEQILLEVVTPDRVVVSEKVDVVVAPGTEGEFGVLANHIPFFTSLKIGELYYRSGNKIEYLAVTGGYAEVLSDKMTVLADAAERAGEIDIDRARRAIERANGWLSQTKKDSQSYARAEAALRRAVVRIQIAEKRVGQH